MPGILDDLLRRQSAGPTYRWVTQDGVPQLEQVATPAQQAATSPQNVTYTRLPGTEAVDSTRYQYTEPTAQAPQADSNEAPQVQPRVGPPSEGILAGPLQALDAGVQRGVSAVGDAVSRLNETERGRQSLNAAIDATTGLPFGIASTLVNPRIVPTSWGTPFNTGGGGIIGLGGELSRRNLERVHGQALAEHAPTGETNPHYLQEAFGGGATPTHAPGATTNFYAPGTIPGVNTPIATHAGFIPGTRVVSGNTNLISGLPTDPHTGQAVTDATTIDTFAQERIAAEAAQRRQAEAAALEDRRLREAAAAAERQREADRIAAQRAEQTRRERAAAEAARAEAQRQANVRAANAALEAQRQRDRDSGRSQIQQGRAVTDSRGRAVTDSSGRTVTDRPSTRNESSGGGGGGGGGGRWCCSVMVHEDLWSEKREFARMTAWSLKKFGVKHNWWLAGYNSWGKWVAKNIVKKFGWGKTLMQSFYDYHVESKPYTWKTLAAQAIIFPGAFIAAKLGAKAPEGFRLAKKEEI